MIHPDGSLIHDSCVGRWLILLDRSYCDFNHAYHVVSFHCKAIQSMKAVVQRVRRASLHVDGALVSSIGPGLVVLAALVEGDTEQDIQWMAHKLVHMRVFPDDSGHMNRSVMDTGGQILLVSNFTVAGQTKKGRRPSFTQAMAPERAARAFATLIEATRQLGVGVSTGVFGAHMEIELLNDGPVTLIVDSQA